MRRNNLLGLCLVLCVIGVFYMWKHLGQTTETRSRFIAKSNIISPQPKRAEKGVSINVLKEYGDGGDTLQEIKAAREALEEFRLQQEATFEKEREKLDKGWESLKADRERLESEKEEFAAAVKLGVYDRRRDKTAAEAEEEEEFRKHQQELNKLAPADPTQFEGLNSTEVKIKHPGITLLPEYRMRTFIDPRDMHMGGMQGSPKVIEDMDDVQAEERFYEIMTKVHVDCMNVERMGARGDGGWDLCVSHPYTPRTPCLVYSFGINNDFTFDDAISYRYSCDVRSFDPSMTTGDHKHSPKVWFYQLGIGPKNTVNNLGWKLETLGSIMGKCGHLQREIDVLKIDIDYNEWEVIPALVKEGVLSKVKQLVLEIHTPEVYIVNRPSTREDFYVIYNTMLELEKQGFRRFSVRYNIHGQYLSQRSGKHRTCCYELSYINIRFLKS